MLFGRRNYEHLAGAFEPAVVLKRTQGFFNFGPGVVFFGFRQSTEHLMQGTKRLLLKLKAIEGGVQANRGNDTLDADILEPCI